MDLIPQALCSLSDVKLLLQTDMGTAQDEWIKLAINQLSSFAEESELMNRSLERKLYVEYFDGPRDYLIVSAPPFTDLTKLQVWDGGWDRIFDDTTKLILHEDYKVTPDRGIIRPFVSCLFTEGSQSIRVEYLGGLIVPDIVAGKCVGPKVVPSALRGAAVMQVVSWFKNRSQWGVNQVSIPGGAQYMNLDPSKIMQTVMKTLMSYRRFD